MTIQCPECKANLDIYISTTSNNVYCKYNDHYNECSKFTRNIFFKGFILKNIELPIQGNYKLRYEDLPKAPKMLLTVYKESLLKAL